MTGEDSFRNLIDVICTNATPIHNWPFHPIQDQTFHNSKIHKMHRIMGYTEKSFPMKDCKVGIKCHVNDDFHLSFH